MELAKEGVKTITPFLAIGGKEIIKSAASDLWKFIKGIAKSKEEENLIEEFEASPNDPSLNLKLIELLESKIRHDENLTSTLTEIIRTTQATEEFKSYVTQIGDNNIALTGKIQNSTININK
jgi:hypothetical protein